MAQCADRRWRRLAWRAALTTHVIPVRGSKGSGKIVRNGNRFERGLTKLRDVEMPMNILQSEHGSRPGRRFSLWRSGHRGVIVLSAAVVLLLPLGLTAQEAQEAQETSYGTGVQSPLQFAGELAPINLISLNVGASAYYDDNALSTNANRQGDEALSLNAGVGASKSTDRLTFNFGYTPSFLFYQQFTEYDRINHSANLGVSYRISDHLLVSLHDSLAYQNGILPSITGTQQILAGQTPPTALNGGIYAYTNRTLTNMTGLNVTYQKSRRTSLTFSGGYNRTKYGNGVGQNTPLYNGNIFSGSARYSYRTSEHTTVGATVIHEDSTYKGGQVFGNQQRFQIESAMFNVTAELSPTVSVTASGGPQILHIVGQSGNAKVANGLQPSAGASITKQVRTTAFSLAAQRAVTDGGGLYTSVQDTTITGAVRQRLFGHWEGGLSLGATKVNTSLFELASYRTDALTAGARIVRPLHNGANFHISYETLHQISKGGVTVGDTFDRNIIMVGFDYRLKSIPLGR
jgi:hypothetical protein